MNITSVMFATPEYDELVAMRIATLYEPLNAEITVEHFAKEYKDVHLRVQNDQSVLIAAVVAKVCEEEDEFMNKRKICLLRQVVVRKDLQGTGLGREVLESIEKLLISKGYKEIRLHAHVGVLDFYTKFGYVKHGKEFTDYGIQLHIMKKKIQKKSEKLEKLEAEGAAY
ncbi:MAG: Unknown protein [uncultured Aureispira sp.]|uniref:N-acetyltransferase domain-containing protein n=1 Tax=uncultured Aureispira sp. TaxID=1331704 RepID=A0A6S6UC62_9BACT|nr:MAG: Unknown protein [uncultured Aureispira sp.]